MNQNQNLYEGKYYPNRHIIPISNTDGSHVFYIKIAYQIRLVLKKILENIIKLKMKNHQLILKNWQLMLNTEEVGEEF